MSSPLSVSRASRPAVRRRRLTPSVDLAIFFVGLIAAAASGVVAYRIVGPYGDGFLNMGVYRTTDPETGKDSIYREVRNPNGTRVRYASPAAGEPLNAIRVVGAEAGQGFGVYVDGARLTGFGIDRDGDGQADVRDYYDEQLKLVKQGFSVSGTGGIDAWQYRDATGAVVRVETSRQQTGTVDRWEHYAQGQLVRVEEDDDHDGKPDHWLTYEDGILIHESGDRNKDGQPDSRP